MLNKEECVKALEDIAFIEGFMNLDHMLNYDGAIALKYKVIHQLIEEHFSSSECRVETRNNPPLKFEELKEGMWVWDNLSKTYIKLKNQFLVYGEWIWQGEKVGCGFISDLYFEANRFYRKEVKE